MSKVFLKRGNFYNMEEGNFTVADSLDEGVYKIHRNPMTGELFLEKISQSFDFGFKLYGIDEKLVSHVVNTYNKQESKHNIGVLLNGAKGTGKTVTAKYICNKLGLPVIICDTPYDGLPFFLASIGHDCVFFFDEFEKNFRVDCGDGNNDCAGEDLLSIMDGVYNSSHCHIFLLTTNELKVNDNLISRPSRVRYLKSFGDVMSRKILEEFVDDNLVKKEYKEEIMAFVDTLTMATIDIVKSIVDEVNLHDVHVDEFKNFFNVKEATFRYYTKYYVFEKGVVEATKKEFIDRCGTYDRDGDEEWRPYHGTLTIKKPIQKLKKGDKVFNNNWRITEVDLDNHFISAKDFSNGYRDEYIYIDNLDVSPSLYDGSESYYDDEYGYFY